MNSIDDILRTAAVRSPLESRVRRALADPVAFFKRRLARLFPELEYLRAQEPVWRYADTRNTWQLRALRRELFGPPAQCPEPPRHIPPELWQAFAMNGRVEIEYNYLVATYPSNYPLIYTDDEIDAYREVISQNLSRTPAERRWSIYGELDGWVCDALAKYPIAGKTVVNMGSLSPWYEAMCIHFGAHPVTIDYNPILLKTSRMSFMTAMEWERDRRMFDVGLSISSFEHDGLGMYGDPLDPDGDLKAMRKMKERIVPDGLLLLAVPVGHDKIIFNNARIYGRARLPLLTQGWSILDSLGLYQGDIDGPGNAQPLFVLRND